MKLIYADFNDIAADGSLPLTCNGSIDSIATLREPLRDGEKVYLTDDELRTEAHVFLRADGSWEARSDWRFEPVAPPKSRK
jgi:hypothetical protein